MILRSTNGGASRHQTERLIRDKQRTDAITTMDDTVNTVSCCCLVVMRITRKVWTGFTKTWWEDGVKEDTI